MGTMPGVVACTDMGFANKSLDFSECVEAIFVKDFECDIAVELGVPNAINLDTTGSEKLCDGILSDLFWRWELSLRRRLGFWGCCGSSLMVWLNVWVRSASSLWVASLGVKDGGSLRRMVDSSSRV